MLGFGELRSSMGDDSDSQDVFSGMLNRLQSLSDRLSNKEAEAAALLARKCGGDVDCMGKGLHEGGRGAPTHAPS